MVASIPLAKGDVVLEATPLTFSHSKCGDVVWMTEFVASANDDAMNKMQELFPREYKTRKQWWKKLYHNAFQIRRKRHGTILVVYYSPSWLNHSCEPNADYFIDPSTLKLTVKALKDISAGDEISISYGDLEWFKARQIECFCQKCSA